MERRKKNDKLMVLQGESVCKISEPEIKVQDLESESELRAIISEQNKLKRGRDCVCGTLRKLASSASMSCLSSRRLRVVLLPSFPA